MTTPYILAREAWKRVPTPIKSMIRKVSMLNRIKSGVNKLVSPKFDIQSADSHDDIYNADYFYIVDEDAKLGASIIADYIARTFHPKSVLDVGCGTGTLMNSLASLQIAVKGLEYSEAALRFCRKRKLNVQKFDLENDILTKVEQFDLVVSMEVAEHLPASVSDRYIDLLTQSANRVVFTAATPGQGGHDHVNEQPHEYWIDKFSRRNFRYNEPLSLKWREEWSKTTIPFWYSHNLMIFER